MSDEALPMLFGGGRLIAEVDVPEAPEGVLFALGDWSSGICAYVAEGVLCAALALPGDAISVRAEQPLAAGPAQLGCQLRHATPPAAVHLDLLVGRGGRRHGRAARSPSRWPGSTAAPRSRSGYDRGLPVTDAYTPPFPWNGDLHRVVIDAGHYQPPPVDVVRVALEVD